MRLILFLVVITLLTAACQKSEVKELTPYEGPMRVVRDVDMLYAEHDHLQVHMKAGEIREFLSGDRDFPKGIYLEFYNDSGRITSTLRANEAYFFRKENQWRGRGDVVVKNLDKNQELNSEELFWKPETKKIFTDKFVTIRLENEVVYGKGLDALQDMSLYTIKEPKGRFEVKE